MATYGYQGSAYDITINTSGVYNIDAFGAQGGAVNPAFGGSGAETGAMFNLTAGERIRIIVGGMGVGGLNGAGGGGGSFVLASTDSGATYSLLLASGGGGGAGGFADGRGVAGGNAHVVSDGSGLGSGGSGGSGAGGGGGGSGFQTGGGNGGNPSPGMGAASYTSFGANGDFAGRGGYGGGGDGGNNGAGGGGGGYSGGNGGDSFGGGGGGTSFISNQGAAVSAQMGATHTGNGSVTITFVMAAAFPAAPSGSYPSTGKSVTFDGTQNVTATKGDLLVLTLDPQNFAGGAEQNGNVVLSATNGTSATITNAFLTSDGIPNTFLPQGDFLIGRDGFSITSTKANSILIGLPGSEQINDVVDPTLAAGSHFISGGVGRFDSTDGADSITIGGKGKWAIYANAGADVVTQDSASTSAFDSASVVNVYGQEGADSIALTNAANKASIFVSGGTEADSISVVNSGTTTIFGGVDSTDGADSITFNGVASGDAGTSIIFGNGGNDTITVGGVTPLSSNSTTTVYGGFGDDRIAVTAASGSKATISVLGGEGADRIGVVNYGNTYITGGNQTGDQSLDGNDTITFNGSGNVLIYGNAGDDRIDFILTDSANASTISIYGGKGNDTVTESILADLPGVQNGAKAATVFIAGGEDGDTIISRGNGGALTIYGGTSSSDSADGADSILYTGGTGTANIFANGGNDTVSIGTLGTDSVNTVTVYGGGGADSIVIAGQAAGQQALTVYGNEGPDSFSIAKGTGQTITIADFATSADKLALTGLGGTPGQLQVTVGSFQTLQQALDAAANTANGASGASKAAAVAFASSTYVVIDNTAGAGFQATDQAIKLTGVTDLVGLIGSTTLSA